MCRIFFAYRTKNTKKKLHKFLEQTYRQKKHTPGINSKHDNIPVRDGFGLASLGPKSHKWSVYKQPTTYDKDTHLEDKIKRMPRFFVLGHLRGIIHHESDDLRQENTHPFQYKNTVFLHNGYIKRFRDHMPILLAFIEPVFLPDILGKTDSEIIFYMYLSELERTKKYNTGSAHYIQAMRVLIKYINNMSVEFVGNFVFSNETVSVITRYMNKSDEPPSLYFDTSDGGLLITSEPVTDEFQAVPRNTMIFMDNRSGLFSFLGLL